MSINNLLKMVAAYYPDADFATIEKAYELAAKAHEGQLRRSGDPYIIHPLAVAEILAELEMDTATIIAALLHDVVEDTELTIDDIENMFGEEVAVLVSGVTKLEQIDFSTREERQVENIRKMFLAMAKDVRVILIKLADRLHNMRTLKYQPEDRRKEIARETLEIFAPLANRIGLNTIKWKLEDLSLRYLNPDAYYDIVKKVAKTRNDREEYINSVISFLRGKLQEANIEAEIEGRPKHFYSIYSKMQKQMKEFAEILDIMAIRVLVNTVDDCYGVLGQVHALWKPVPGRFKDYIAMPKSNMYQSLHTTVIALRGEPLEIQIRTWEMHRTSEYGIAAHWRYKEGVKEDKVFEQKLSWLRQILDWQQDMNTSKEFVESLKTDLFANTVFVFTPHGDVLELPANSTPVDFAYRIHTDIGNRCIGAKVNNKIVSLDYKLNNGDIVNIMTSKQANGPSRDWLNIVQTSQARNKIKQWFRKELREENISRGREAWERELKKQGIDNDEIKHDKFLEAGRKYNLDGTDDIFAAVGERMLTAAQLLSRLDDPLIKNRKQKRSDDGKSTKTTAADRKNKKTKTNQGIKVKGVDGLLVRLSHCCNPVPGDKIVGYITKGRGVSIHRADCLNASLLRKDACNRMVEVAWAESFDDAFQVRLEIKGLERVGLLNDITTVLTTMGISANQVSGRTTKEGEGIINLSINIHSLEELRELVSKISRIKGVFEVKRLTFGYAEGQNT